VDNAKTSPGNQTAPRGWCDVSSAGEVASERQFALALRWLVDFADARKGLPMKAALAAEFGSVSGQGNAIRKRDEVHKMAQANKALCSFPLVG